MNNWPAYEISDDSISMRQILVREETCDTETSSTDKEIKPNEEELLLEPLNFSNKLMLAKVDENVKRVKSLKFKERRWASVKQEQLHHNNSEGSRRQRSAKSARNRSRSPRARHVVSFIENDIAPVSTTSLRAPLGVLEDLTPSE